ncbi:MAG: glycosyltransferase family 2 protein [Elusimicrobiota bacterium]
MSISLSAILIAKDEEVDLPGCLAALSGLARETVVVVSDDSSDRTEQIALAHGAKVVHRRFDDYTRMRQASLDAATSDWCLWIDPDERVSASLAAQIRSTLAAGPSVDGFHIPFSVLFLGRILRWGGLGSETHLRLFRRSKGKFVGGLLHESLAVDGKTALLKGRIVHEPYRDIPDYLSKLDRYTTLAALKRLEARQRAHALHDLLLPWDFFSRVVLKLGFLDGRPGLTWAGLSAFHRWLKYAKLAEMQRGQTP